jgi:hypothetical protein
MCKPASLIITKERVFWSAKADSHEDIIREFDLKDEVAGKITIVRVEITPPGGDMSLPLDQWQFHLDQDLLPVWYEKAPEKQQGRAMDALADWAAQKIIREGFREVREAHVYAFGSATVEASDSATVEAFGSATVEASDSATVEAFGSATVRAFGSATVRAFGSATVRAFGSANGVIYSCKSVEVADTAALIDRRGVKIKLLTAKKS